MIYKFLNSFGMLNIIFSSTASCLILFITATIGSKPTDIVLESLTYEKMLEGDANKAESLQRLLKTIPIPMGKTIVIG